MKRKLFKILLFAVVTLLVGCGKKPDHYLVVRGYTPVEKDARFVRNAGATVDLKLYSIEYNLAYQGSFDDCTAEDPITGDHWYSATQKRCPLPPPDTMLLVTHQDCGGFGDVKCTYLIYTETHNSRTIKVAFRVEPDIN